MPLKSRNERARAAKARGTPMIEKRSDAGPTGRSPHAAKKSRANTGAVTFRERAVSGRSVKGGGRALRGEKLPLPGGRGSTGDARQVRPDAPGAKPRKPRRPRRAT